MTCLFLPLACPGFTPLFIMDYFKPYIVILSFCFKFDPSPPLKVKLLLHKVDLIYYTEHFFRYFAKLYKINYIFTYRESAFNISLPQHTIFFITYKYQIASIKYIASVYGFLKWMFQIMGTSSRLIFRVI